MWLTRFQDRSSVSTKTKFGRSSAAGLGWMAAGDVQPATAAKTASEEADHGSAEFPVLRAERIGTHPGMLLSPEEDAYAAWVSVARGLSQLADVYYGNSRAPGD